MDTVAVKQSLSTAAGLLECVQLHRPPSHYDYMVNTVSLPG